MEISTFSVPRMHLTSSYRKSCRLRLASACSGIIGYCYSDFHSYFSMTAGEYAWDYGFEVFNVYCSGQKTKLQVMGDLS